MKRIVALVLALAATGALAQGFPSKPVRIVSGTTPGSASDTVARAIVERLGANMGQSVVVENRTGGGGIIGLQHVLKSDPDGYTLNVNTAALTTSALMSAQPFDPIKDVTFVATIAVLPTVLVVSTQRGVKSVADLVRIGRAKPGELNYTTVGVGSSTWMNAEKFIAAANMKATHVPVRGAPEGVTEIITGRADFFFAPVFSVLSHMKEGKLVGIAVGSPKRSTLVPDLPTTVEAGVPGSEYLFWVGIVGPARMPADVTKRLHDEINRAVASDDVRDRLQKLGTDPLTMTQADFAAMVKVEYAENEKLIRAAGIKSNN